MATIVTGELKNGLLAQLFEIEKQIRGAKGYPYDLLKLRKCLQNAIEGKFGDMTIGDVYTITIPNGSTVNSLIKAGKYDWSDSVITDDHFPIRLELGKSTDLVLVHYDRDMSNQAVLNDLKLRGLRPAEPAELLMFGFIYPEKQREFPVVALGSPWRNAYGYHCVLFLDRHDGRRRLGLYCIMREWYYDWHGGCRFMAVRE
ncbi:MAG: hypothetical protein PHT40_03075 [Patescibacteria group bacterium]|nr:hypothetical protein [Patescibacteria group bacterium]